MASRQGAKFKSYSSAENANPRPRLKRDFRFSGMNFKMFTLVASLAVKIQVADSSVRSTIATLDISSLVSKMEKSKSLFHLFSHDGVIDLDDLSIALKVWCDVMR